VEVMDCMLDEEEEEEEEAKRVVEAGGMVRVMEGAKVEKEAVMEGAANGGIVMDGITVEANGVVVRDGKMGEADGAYVVANGVAVTDGKMAGVETVSVEAEETGVNEAMTVVGASNGVAVTDGITVEGEPRKVATIVGVRVLEGAAVGGVLVASRVRVGVRDTTFVLEAVGVMANGEEVTAGMTNKAVVANGVEVTDVTAVVEVVGVEASGKLVTEGSRVTDKVLTNGVPVTEGITVTDTVTANGVSITEGVTDITEGIRGGGVGDPVTDTVPANSEPVTEGITDITAIGGRVGDPITVPANGKPVTTGVTDITGIGGRVEVSVGGSKKEEEAGEGTPVGDRVAAALESGLFCTRTGVFLAETEGERFVTDAKGDDDKGDRDHGDVGRVIVDEIEGYTDWEEAI